MVTKKRLIVFCLLAMLASGASARSIQYPPRTDNPPAAQTNGGGSSGPSVTMVVSTVVITALIAYVGHKIFKRAQKRKRLLPAGQV